MIIEAGHFALVLALLLSLIGAIAPLWGASVNRSSWMKMADPVSLYLFHLTTLAFLTLICAYALSDFSVQNVAENSHTLKPLFYKLTAAWSNHEGSMLLWLWVLTLCGFFAARSKNLPDGPFRARALAVQAMLAFVFLLYILLVSNPFLRLDVPPLDGAGLNPVLQDPALAFHPPFLYFGYVGFSIVFSFAAAALMEGRAGKDFAAFIRPWVLFAWSMLTIGIALGSFWAYYELGWGGFWFWDPVENASLMPWLCGTMLLHAVMALEKRGVFPAWVLLLCVLAFGFSLTGTFLVRSGVLTSVHAFALDPARGIFMLGVLILTLGSALLLYALRVPRVLSAGALAPVSREGFILFGNLLFFVMLAAIFTGTFYPVFLGVLNAGNITVGPPYYHATIFPVMALVSFLMALAPLLAWGQGNIARVIPVPAGIFLVLGVLAVVFGQNLELADIAGFGFGSWIILGAVYAFYRGRWTKPLWGMVLAHAGMGVLVLGVTAATALKIESIRYMKPGEHINIGQNHLTFMGVKNTVSGDYDSEIATFMIERGGDASFLNPERRWWHGSEMQTSESALDFSWRGITYAVLGDAHPKDKDKRVVRVWVHPFAYLIWSGGILMALGGLIASRRKPLS